METATGPREWPATARFVPPESGEWNRKGAALSDVTAQKEYGVTRDFIVKGIQAGKLEFREGVVWGNPYLRVLRSQLELYIAAQLGSEYLVSRKSQTELRADMAGKIPLDTPPRQPQSQNILEAHDFGYSWALAEARGGTPGAAHTTFVKECMAGRQR